MNYQSNSDHGGGFRRLPRPSSSGTLPGGPQYEPANKRQRTRETGMARATHIPQPLPYHVAAPAVSYPYFVQPPAVSRPLPQPYVGSEWSPQPWYQETSQVTTAVEQQQPRVESRIDYEEAAAVESDGNDDSQDEGAAEEGTGGTQTLTVPGTSIVLETEEDIRKWREERKRMWLLKISNNKQKHMQDMGIKEEELKGQKSTLQEARKQKQFIQNIQNQVNRLNPRSTLSVRIAQREMARENSKLLDFIERLGDSGLLNCELTDDEKEKLFGSNDAAHKKGRNFTRSADSRRSDTYGPNKYHRR